MRVPGVASSLWFLVVGSAPGCGVLPEAPAVYEAPLVAVEGETVCRDLHAGEWFAATSPEGHGWFVTPWGDQTVVRVVDPLAEVEDRVETLDVADVAQVRAWGASEATLLTPRTVWQLGTDFVRTRVSTPEGFLGAASSCGDLWLDGFVALPDRLVRHRGGDVFGWTFGDDGAIPEALLSRDGACVGPDGALWGIEADGTLWTIDDRGAERTVQVGDWVAAAAADQAVSVLTADRWWIGGRDGWEGWTVAGRHPRLAAAGGADLWAASRRRLYRYREGVFSTLASPLHEAPARALRAHAGGVWVVGDREACHVALEPALRLEGVRPHTRSRTGGYRFRVSAEAAVVATLDGLALPVVEAPEGGSIVEGQLTENRWHEFRFVAGAAERSLYVERVPALVPRSWDADIRPLFQASCDGAGCHAAGSAAPADLSTHAAWVERADAIRQRVVVGESMPPAADRAGWASDHVEIVFEWLEGGMSE